MMIRDAGELGSARAREVEGLTGVTKARGQFVVATTALYEHWRLKRQRGHEGEVAGNRLQRRRRRRLRLKRAHQLRHGLGCLVFLPRCDPSTAQRNQEPLTIHSLTLMYSISIQRSGI